MATRSSSSEEEGDYPPAPPLVIPAQTSSSGWRSYLDDDEEADPQELVEEALAVEAERKGAFFVAPASPPRIARTPKRSWQNSGFPLKHRPLAAPRRRFRLPRLVPRRVLLSGCAALVLLVPFVLTHVALLRKAATSRESSTNTPRLQPPVPHHPVYVHQRQPRHYPPPLT